MSAYRDQPTLLERELAAENECLRFLAIEHLHARWRESDRRARAEIHAAVWRFVAALAMIGATLYAAVTP